MENLDFYILDKPKFLGIDIENRLVFNHFRAFTEILRLMCSFILFRGKILCLWDDQNHPKSYSNFYETCRLEIRIEVDKGK